MDNWQSRNLDPFGVMICRNQTQVSHKLWVMVASIGRPRTQGEFVVGQGHEPGGIAKFRNVFEQSVSNVGLARTPESHFHALRGQPKTGLRFALVVEDELARIEKSVNHRDFSRFQTWRS